MRLTKLLGASIQLRSQKSRRRQPAHLRDRVGVSEGERGDQVGVECESAARSRGLHEQSRLHESASAIEATWTYVTRREDALGVDRVEDRAHAAKREAGESIEVSLTDRERCSSNTGEELKGQSSSRAPSDAPCDER